jgi:hypothetical protein
MAAPEGLGALVESVALAVSEAWVVSAESVVSEEWEASADQAALVESAEPGNLEALAE